jgi:hypothetical protein
MIRKQSTSALESFPASARKGVLGRPNVAPLGDDVLR